MNKADTNELADYWHRETRYVNDKVDEAFKDAQDHAYELGLKRGKEEVTDLAKRLVAARDAEDQREWVAILDAIYKIGAGTTATEGHKLQLSRLWRARRTTMEQTEREAPKVGLSAGLGATQIEIADTVHHGPTGEDWVVARVTDRHVYPAGWPPCRADLADCTLIGKATEKQRAEMMANLRKLPPSDERHIAPNRRNNRRLKAVRVD